MNSEKYEIVDYTSQKANEIRIKKTICEYVIKNMINNKNGPIKFSEETWCIEWYVLYVLRKYEPHFIKSTLTYCYGASNFLQRFMKENIKFMIDMQFLPRSQTVVMVLLIEEKILDFKHKNKKISDSEYLHKIFPLRIKNLEKELQMMFPIINKNITVSFEYWHNRSGNNYMLNIDSEELLRTKFVFQNNYKKYNSNDQSSCYKIHNVNFNDTKTWIKNSKEKIDKKKIDIIPAIVSKRIVINEISNIKKELVIMNNSDNEIIYKKTCILTPKNNGRYIYFPDNREILNLETIKINKLKHKNSHACVSFTKNENTIKCIDSYSYTSYISIELVSIYCIKHGCLLGLFEFNVPQFDGIHNIDVEGYICPICQ